MKWMYTRYSGVWSDDS